MSIMGPMIKETVDKRAARILRTLKDKYPGKKAYDLDGRALHFVCEVEPQHEHPEYDRAVEVIIKSKPHKHHKMTQDYTILSGNLELHVDDKVLKLHSGDKYTIHPEQIHWAVSEDECWLEIYSQPGWTAEDHIVVEPINIEGL